ncbi:MAG: hypothetical protein L3J24_11800 [Xanthomonadales bacterium]|nr:hypothetical protein [Xanthomonadales bacterium]
MTKEEIIRLTNALSLQGKLSFNVSAVIGGIICGTVYGTKRKNNGDYKLTIRHRLLLRFNASYRNILKFIELMGFENINVAQVLGEGSIKSKLQITLAKECAPNWQEIIKERMRMAGIV